MAEPTKPAPQINNPNPGKVVVIFSGSGVVTSRDAKVVIVKRG